MQILHVADFIGVSKIVDLSKIRLFWIVHFLSVQKADFLDISQKGEFMLLYLLFAPLNLIMSLICYITNPIALLFCDEDGELPFFLNLWQTWDNSCNPSDLKSMLPKYMTYWWDAHYTEHKVWLAEVNRERWETLCIDNNFTLKERILRYLCRLYWLTRNCGYGWSFYAYGVDIAGHDMTVYKQTDKILFANYWLTSFIYKDDDALCTIGGYEIRKCFFLGWKIDMDAVIPSRAMLANRLAFRFKKIS